MYCTDMRSEVSFFFFFFFFFCTDMGSEVSGRCVVQTKGQM